jgi:ribonuclease-3
MATSGAAGKDPKTELQELIQGRSSKPPRYKIVSQEGPDHEPCFTVEVHADDLEAAQGQGGSRQDAEKAAARAMLKALEKLSNWGQGGKASGGKASGGKAK